MTALSPVAAQTVAFAARSSNAIGLPIVEAARSHFNTCTAAARRMAAQGSGVIVTLSTTAAREWRHEMGGFSDPEAPRRAAEEQAKAF